MVRNEKGGPTMRKFATLPYDCYIARGPNCWGRGRTPDQAIRRGLTNLPSAHRRAMEREHWQVNLV